MPSVDAPTEVWITTVDGERVACLIEQVGLVLWQATPVRDVTRAELEGVEVDRLPAGHSISFVLRSGDD